MSPSVEKQILLGILRLVEQPIESESKRWRVLSVLIFIAVGSAMFYGFHAFRELSVTQMLAVLIGVVVGAVGAFLMASAFFAERIGVICRVVDRDLVQARLRELGA